MSVHSAPCDLFHSWYSVYSVRCTVSVYGSCVFVYFWHLGTLKFYLTALSPCPTVKPEACCLPGVHLRSLPLLVLRVSVWDPRCRSPAPGPLVPADRVSIQQVMISPMWRLQQRSSAASGEVVYYISVVTARQDASDGTDGWLLSQHQKQPVKETLQLWHKKKW